MNESIHEMLSQGIECGKDGRPHDALDCFLKVLKIDKNNLKAWQGSAIAWQKIAEYSRQSSDDEAVLKSAQSSEKCWNEVIRRENSNAEAWFGKGSVLFDYLGRSEESFDCFTKTLELDKNHVLALMNKGIILDNANQPKDAIMCFKLGLKLDETCQPLWYNSGVTLARCGLNKEALDCFTKSIELDNTHINSWLSKSKILKILGDEKEFKFCMKKYNELTGNNSII